MNTVNCAESPKIGPGDLTGGPAPRPAGPERHSRSVAVVSGEGSAYGTAKEGSNLAGLGDDQRYAGLIP